MRSQNSFISAHIDQVLSYQNVSQEHIFFDQKLALYALALHEGFWVLGLFMKLEHELSRVEANAALIESDLSSFLCYFVHVEAVLLHQLKQLCRRPDGFIHLFYLSYFLVQDILDQLIVPLSARVDD